jgi:hypothetical protein
MRRAVLGFLLGAGLLTAVAVWFAPGNSVLAQHARASAPQDGEVIALHWTDDGKHHETVALVDPQRKVMSVYQIDRASGAIALKSVRQCAWDLQLGGFNENRPTAEEIRQGMTNQR